jgi:hypothetical protein
MNATAGYELIQFFKPRNSAQLTEESVVSEPEEFCEGVEWQIASWSFRIVEKVVD